MHLGRGESIDVAPGRIVFLEEGVRFRSQPVRGWKNLLFGGSGPVLARLTGPGRVCLQTRDATEAIKKVVVNKTERPKGPGRPRPPHRDDIQEKWIWDGHRDD